MSDSTPTDDDEAQPCGEYHPLPCGLDTACGFIENSVHKQDVREVISTFTTSADDNKRKAKLHGEASPELANFYRGIAVGRERSATDLRELVDDE